MNGKNLAENNLKEYLENEIEHFIDEAECECEVAAAQMLNPTICKVEHSPEQQINHDCAVELQKVLDNLKLGGIGALI